MAGSVRPRPRHFTMMPFGSGVIGSAGLEPARYFYQQILSLLCLPFHHEPE